MPTRAEKRHMDIVAEVGCVICRRDKGIITPCHVHHLGEGTSERSDFMTAGLCPIHHTGELGVHGMGVKQFLRVFSLPHEYHLLVLVNEFRAKDNI